MGYHSTTKAIVLAEIITSLRNGATLSTSELAAVYDYSARSVQRWLVAIEAEVMPLERVGKGRYRRMEVGK